MKIERVYLAGGINGLGDADANAWRDEAKCLLPRDIAVIDPMARDYRGKEDENVAAIVEGDKGDIQSCQAILAMCSRPSWGTAMEIGWSHDHPELEEYIGPYIGEMGERYGGKRVVVGKRLCVAIVPDGRPVSPWLRYHTDAIVSSLEEAVEALGLVVTA